MAERDEAILAFSMPRYDLIVASLCSIFMLDSACMMKEVAPLKKVFLLSRADLALSFLLF